MESAIYEGGLCFGNARWQEDMKALVHLYQKWHEDLLIFTFFIVQDPETALDVIRALFGQIWEKRHTECIASVEYKNLLVEIRKLCLANKFRTT